MPSGQVQVHPGAHGSRRAIAAAATIYFCVVFGTGFALGALRVTFVVPRIGERYAELAEMPLMFAAVFLAAGYVIRRYRTVDAPGAWLAVGGIALALLLLAEFLLGVALAGRSVAEYIASRDPVSGSVYLGMLVLFAAMPWLRRAQRIAPPR